MQMFNLLIRPTEATNNGFNVKKVRQNTVTHKRKFYINETFSWTNTTLSTADGARELRLAFIVSPAKEKILSDGALVAVASTTLASLDSVGYVCATNTDNCLITVTLT